MNLPDRRRAGVITSALLFILTFAAAGCTAETSAGEIGAEEVLARVEAGTAPLLLDVRTPEEYASGHVPGAVNIPHNRLASRVGEIDGHRSKEVVVYCERGGRAAKAETVLEGAGFTELRHLTGDMSAWRQAGRPTE